jgi:DNA-binding transcriptional LysR family regulator
MTLADLNAVGCFAKVVELESFRAAAAALGIPKSTLSRKIAELEDALDARLLERTTRRLRLTDAGQAYHQRIAPALDALREAERAVEAQNAKPSGRLKLTMTAEGGQTLAPIFAEYLSLHPGVRLQMELTDRRVDLVEEGFDLAIRAGALPDSTLVAKRLSPVAAFRVYASPRYLAARGTPRHPRELGEHDCLVMSAQSTPLTWSFQERGKALPIKVRAHTEANSFILLRELAAAGHGIVRIPDYLALQLPQSAEGLELRELLIAFVPPPMPWHVVYASSRHLSPKVRALVDLLELRLSQMRKPGRGGGRGIT